MRTVIQIIGEEHCGYQAAKRIADFEAVCAWAARVGEESPDFEQKVTEKTKEDRRSGVYLESGFDDPSLGGVVS